MDVALTPACQSPRVRRRQRKRDEKDSLLDRVLVRPVHVATTSVVSTSNVKSGNVVKPELFVACWCEMFKHSESVIAVDDFRETRHSVTCVRQFSTMIDAASFITVINASNLSAVSIEWPAYRVFRQKISENGNTAARFTSLDRPMTSVAGNVLVLIRCGRMLVFSLDFQCLILNGLV